MAKMLFLDTHSEGSCNTAPRSIEAFVTAFSWIRDVSSQVIYRCVYLTIFHAADASFLRLCTRKWIFFTFLSEKDFWQGRSDSKIKMDCALGWSDFALFVYNASGVLLKSCFLTHWLGWAQKKIHFFEKKVDTGPARAFHFLKLHGRSKNQNA